jgi:hypothetical protein
MYLLSHLHVSILSAEILSTLSFTCNPLAYGTETSVQCIWTGGWMLSILMRVDVVPSIFRNCLGRQVRGLWGDGSRRDVYTVWCFCGDDVSWWLLIPNTGKWYVESYENCSCGPVYLCAWGLIIWSLALLLFFPALLCWCSLCWVVSNTIITPFLAALLMLPWCVMSGYITVITLFVMDSPWVETLRCVTIPYR